MTSATSQHSFKKPTIKTLSKEFDATLPDVQLYRRLVEAEHKIDATINRKKLDLQDTAARSDKKTEVVRVFVSNSVEHQPWQTVAGVDEPGFAVEASAETKEPAWQLRIEGRVLDDAAEVPAAAEGVEEEGQNEVERRKFSSFFTSIAVQLDKEKLAPGENGVAEWHEDASAPGRVSFDALDIRRRGSQPVAARITLQPKEQLDAFELSPALARVLALQRETRAGVVLALWHYVRVHKLQDAEEKRVVRCDAALKEVLGVDKFVFAEVGPLLEAHLLTPPPVVIEYEIQVEAENNVGEHVYDIEVSTSTSAAGAGAPRGGAGSDAQSYAHSLLSDWNRDAPALQALDDQIALTIQAMTNSRLKQRFLDGLARDPAATIGEWLDSQATDLRVIQSDRGFNEEEVRHSSFYTEEVLNQSVHLFLNNRR